MKTQRRESYFLVSQGQIDKIDSLIGALNLAVSEILESCPVRDQRAERMEAQLDYDERIGDVIYPNHSRSSF